MSRGLKQIQSEIISSNIIRLTFLITVIIGVFIIGFRGWINDEYQLKLIQQLSCYNMGGDWTLFTQECESTAANEDVFENVCIDTGGSYQGCISPCRNQVNAEVRVCQVPCVNVCKY